MITAEFEKERKRMKEELKKSLRTYGALLLLGATGVPLGAAVGLIEALFCRLLLKVTAIRVAHLFWCLPFLAMAGLVIVAVNQKFGGRGKGGMSLIFDVAYEEETELPLRMIPLAMLSTALTHLFGGSAGREGVAVQIGAVFSYFAGKKLPFKNAPGIFLVTGMAAGFAGMFGTPIAALVGSNNLSTAIILLGICAFLIFISHPGYLPFLGIGGAGIGFIAVFLMMESYRLERLAIWRNPEAYEKGFQTIQGLYAIGSGRIFGCGLGKGLQKLGFVPEAQNDMIFSIICEEGGLFGACLVIAVFAVLIWRLMVISIHARDLGGALIAGGIMGHIALQVILNIAVVTNTIPNTGITLPFISYGGTSVLFLLGEMGLALSVSRDTD